MNDPKGISKIETLLKSCFDVDSNGKVYLRTISATFVDGVGLTPAVTADDPTVTSENLLRKAIVLGADSKPALNLAVITSS